MNLSRRGFLAAVAILGLGAGGLWVESDLRGAWRPAAASLLLILLMEAWQVRRIQVHGRWEVPSHMRLGQTKRVAVQLSTTYTRAMRLEMLLRPPPGTEARPNVRSVLLRPGETVEIAETLRAKALGQLDPCEAEVQLCGRFGLSWWPRRLSPSAIIRVVPDLLGADVRSAAGGKPGGVAPTARGHGLELRGLREYVPGDSTRLIDWKASARTARLTVRDTHEDQHLDVVMVLDIGRSAAVQLAGMTQLQHFANAAGRFAQRAVQLGDRVSLLAAASAPELLLPVQGGEVGLRRLHLALSELRPRPEEFDATGAALATRRLLRRRGLVVWLGGIDYGRDALSNAARLLAPLHLPLFLQLRDPELLAECVRPATDWLDPYISISAAQILEAQDLLAQRLRRLGCEVVSSLPIQAEHRVIDRYLALRTRRRI